MSELLPPGWRERALGDVIGRRAERADGSEPLLSVTQKRGVIPQDQVGRRDISSEDKENYWRVFPGDIVYNTMRMWQGVSGVSGLHGIVSPAYTVCKPAADVDSKFLGYLLKQPSVVNKFYRMSQGLVSDTWSLRYAEFSRILVSLPPLGEQRRIAEILDALDLLLAKQQEIASKLESLYLGLTESLVGHLFAEATSPLGDIFSVKAGITLGPGRVPALRPRSYLRVANVQRRSIDLSDLAQMECSATEESIYSLAEGDLLVVEGHANPEEIGRCAMVGRDAVGQLYQNHLFRLRSELVAPKFAEIWLNSSFVRSYWRRMCATSSGLYTINSKMLRNLRVPSIGFEDQSRIIRPIVALEERIGCERSYAERLKLLKQGLAEDLLTGRVRVPEAEAVVESL